MGKLSVLNVGGHPKDAILYAGGTMANHIANGDTVCTLTPTHGLSHHETAIANFKQNKKFNFDSLIAERKNELEAASAELGIKDVRFLGHDDTIILPKPEIIKEITDVILEVKPDIIITHWPNDTVPAHANATQMTLLAIEAASCVQKDDSKQPHSIKQIFFHVSQGRTNIRENSRPPNPTTIIDITDVIHLKSNAMNKFKSQYYGENGNLQRKLGEALDGNIHAIHSRVPYAESFIADQPSLYSLLPLSEYQLSIQNKTKEDNLKHLSQFLIN